MNTLGMGWVEEASKSKQKMKHQNMQFLNKLSETELTDNLSERASKFI